MDILTNPDSFRYGKKKKNMKIKQNSFRDYQFGDYLLIYIIFKEPQYISKTQEATWIIEMV